MLWGVQSFTAMTAGFIGRGERIRTSGLYVPNVALYQAKLHPDNAVGVGDCCVNRRLAANNEGREYIKPVMLKTNRTVFAAAFSI